MDQDMEYRQRQVEEYKAEVLPLLKYLPWLEANQGSQGSTLYKGDATTELSLAFPVYDGTLMQFVKLASKSSLMEKNYQYIYSRRQIKTHDDERKRITSADITDWDMLRGIFSKYVLGGRTKASLWGEGLKEGIFYLVLKQMREILEYWDKPIDVR